MEIFNKKGKSKTTSSSNKEDEKKIYIRQGDVLLEKLNGATTIGKKEQLQLLIPNSKIVAEGELTGHNHSFAKDSQVLLFKEEGTSTSSTSGPQVLVVKEKAGATLSHQEHLPLIVPEGVYKIKGEVEYNPFTLQLNKVKD